MSPPTPVPDQTHACAGPREGVRIARASRRLRIVIDLGDMAITLAQAVHARALAEEAAAMAALAVREAAGAEPEAKPPAPPDTIPSPSARSTQRTRATPRAQLRVGTRAGSRAPGPAPVMGAGALFARLSDIVRQCLELEIRIDEELRRLEADAFATPGLDATLRGQMENAPREVPCPDPARQEDLRQSDARNRIGAMVEAVIEEAAKTRQEASRLYAALRERLDEDEPRRDLASRPDAVRAASLCRALGLHPNPSRWPHPPPDP